MKTSLVDKAAEASAPRQLPVIDPAKVTLDSMGHLMRSWHIRLEADTLADDLKEPSLFRKVQGHASKALNRFDRVLLVDYNEAWMADGYCVAADSTGVTLGGLRIIQMASRTKELFSDGKYKIVWVGTGFRVQRLADLALVTPIVSNEALAERDLRNMYAKKL